MTSDERALHQLVYQLEAAWNTGDGTGFAEAFAEDADFIHILGGYYSGRTAIEAGHRMIFGTIYKGSTVRYRWRRYALSARRRGCLGPPVPSVL